MAKRKDIRNHNKNRYRSNFERSVAANLLKRSVKFDYEPHKICYWKKISSAKCRDCGSKEVYEKHSYLPDFFIPSTKIYVEAKGKFTSVNRTKMLEVIRSNPKLDIRMLFMKDNWITKSHKNKYSEWCEKNGIEYAFMQIPDEWCK